MMSKYDYTIRSMTCGSATDYVSAPDFDSTDCTGGVLVYDSSCPVVTVPWPAETITVAWNTVARRRFGKIFRSFRGRVDRGLMALEEPDRAPVRLQLFARDGPRERFCGIGTKNYRRIQ